MKDPVDHIIRPQLPWRSDAGITECGLNAAKAPTLSRDEYFQRLKDMGKQRAALLTCMTCSGTAGRWGTWSDDPRKALEREIQWETSWRRSERGVRLRDELIAISVLIDSHRKEFEGLVSKIEQQRQWRERKIVGRP